MKFGDLMSKYLLYKPLKYEIQIFIFATNCGVANNVIKIQANNANSNLIQAFSLVLLP